MDNDPCILTGTADESGTDLTAEELQQKNLEAEVDADAEASKLKMMKLVLI